LKELINRGVDHVGMGGKDNLPVEIADHYFRPVQMVPDIEQLLFNGRAIPNRHGMPDSGIGEGFQLVTVFGHPLPHLFTLVVDAEADDRPHYQGNADGDDDEDLQVKMISDRAGKAVHVNAPRHE
jgi:hypothetical protein